MALLSDVKGIGPRALCLLNKIGIYTIEDLVTHYPFRYDVLQRGNLQDTEDGGHIVIDGRIESVPILMRFKAGLNKMNFRLVTQSGVVGVSIFNRAFLKSKLEVGTGVTVIGKFDKSKNVITASEIKLETLSNKVKIEPIYHCTNGLTNKNMATYINMALLMFGKEIKDYIPKQYVEKYNFLNKKTALNIIHNPSTEEKLKEVKIRLKYEELFAFMLKINYLKMENKKNNQGLERKIDKSKLDKFIKKIPFSLTNDQKTAVDDIINDLESKNRMNRLLQGDVGSGKTIVSFIAMVANYLSGYQSALMAPTEILAVQHYNNLKEFLNGTDITVELLTGSTPKKEKQVIYEDLKDGKINIVIGTHALIQEEVTYNNLGLVITDEQHRFGVNQRANLKNKGLLPDTLYMSATPIPRTFALTIYGDMDISNIKTKPKGRKEIKTLIKNENELNEVYEMMMNEIENKHQVYIVSPLIEESEGAIDLTTVNEIKRNIDLYFKGKVKSAIMHGKLSKADKDKIMDEFKKGKIDILISTTVIEVGIDVKNATMMVIYNANMFGLATLHQLRGRVGRNEFESKCVLIGEEDNPRLKVLSESNDGFYITEKDYEMRGEGDLFGVKQSGDMEFKIANLHQDMKILLQARDDSKEFLDNNIKNNFANYQEYAKIVKEIMNLD